VRYQSNNDLSSRLNDTDNRGVGGQQRSPLNDLNPNDIATVEVVKGPSASTLYGPDAANGVIVITTKRGKAGPTEFRWYARPVTSSVSKPGYVTNAYRVWSHVPGTTNQFSSPCTVVYQYIYKICALDSITVGQTIVNTDSLSLIAKSRPTWQYGANVSGGTSTFRYFLSGNYSNQIGIMQVPPALQRLIVRSYGADALTNDRRDPNTLSNVGLQSSMSGDLSSWMAFDGTINYTHVMNTRSSTANFYQSAVGDATQLVGADSATIADYILNGSYRLASALQTSAEETNRITGTLNGRFHPTAWLSVLGLVGLDMNNVQAHTVLPGGLVTPDDGGRVSDDQRATLNRTFSLSATTSAHPSRFSFRSSLGAQYLYYRLDGTSTYGSGLPAGSSDISLAQSKNLSKQWGERVTLGTYGEEVVGLNDRIFLTGALRLDGATTYGDAYHPTPFPKVGLSWIASDEPFLRGMPGLGELRFRYSFGSATKHPTSEMKLGQLTAGSVQVNGSNVNLFWPNELANPDLRPERSNEQEWGADATVLSGIHLELTWWHRRVVDELREIGSWVIGLQNIWLNGGTVAKHGFEAAVNVPLLNTRRIQGDISFSYAFNTSKLVSLPVDPRLNFDYGVSVGLPVDAIVGYPIIGVADTIGGADGIIQDGREIVRDSVLRFLGVRNPPRSLTITPSFTMFGGVVQVSSLIARETGFLANDDYAYQCRYNSYCLAPYLKSTPLLVQAKYVGSNTDDFLVPGDFTRWREFTITASLPQRLLKRLNLLNFQLISQASVSLQGHNLAVWSKFDGTDPESRSSRSVLSDTRVDGIPQARSWSLRFDLVP